MNAKPEIPADISADAEDFLNKTFEFNTELRPSAKELLQHPWIVKVVRLLLRNLAPRRPKAQSPYNSS